MKRTLTLSNEDTLEIMLEDTPQGPRFSVSGTTAKGSYGRGREELAAKYPDNPLVQRIIELWRVYRLNAQHADCAHQRALGWPEKGKTPITQITYYLRPSALAAQSKLRDKALACLEAGETAQFTPKEENLVKLAWERTISDGTNPGPEYQENKRITKTLAWLRPEEHPEGLLNRPCPECGYKYGSAWLYLPIPENTLAEIHAIIEGKDA